jgi:short-subunit dehydrogenase
VPVVPVLLNSIEQTYRDPNLADICAKAIFRQVDITNETAVEDLVTSLAAENLLPDIYIFNAAIIDVDNSPFVEYVKLRKVLEIDMFSTLKFLSCLLPRLNKPATFVFISSGVVIFPNPSNLGYFLGKLAVTRVFDLFSYRYNSFGFRFKTVILGPIACGMLKESRTPEGFVGYLRNVTTGTPEMAAVKIVSFAKNSRRRMYYCRSSAVILWISCFVQAILPSSLKVYQVKTRRTDSKT